MPWKRQLKCVKRVEEGRVLGIPGLQWFFLSVNVPWSDRTGYRRHLEFGVKMKIHRSVTKQLNRAELELLDLIRIYVERQRIAAPLVLADTSEPIVLKGRMTDGQTGEV